MMSQPEKVCMLILGSWIGAPAIAIVAVLSLAVELYHIEDSKLFPQITWVNTIADLTSKVTALIGPIQLYINGRLDYLMNSRPTAVDLSNAITLLKNNVEAKVAKVGQFKAAKIRDSYIEAAEKILHDDKYTNMEIGRYGAEYLRRQ